MLRLTTLPLLVRRTRPNPLPLLRALTTSASTQAATTPYSPTQRFTDTNTTAHPSPLSAPKSTLTLLSRLHARALSPTPTSESNPPPTPSYITPAPGDEGRDFDVGDRLLAITEDKAQFIYTLLRATGATKVVEAGSGFGVGTIYLALAARLNANDLDLGKGGGEGEAKVVAFESGNGMREQAEEYWAQAGVQGVIESRRDIEDIKALEDIGFVLLNGRFKIYTAKSLLPSRTSARIHSPRSQLSLTPVWCPRALPTLELLRPHLRPGATIVADQTDAAADGYADLMAYVDADQAFTRLTLPYHGGLTVFVYYPKSKSHAGDANDDQILV